MIHKIYICCEVWFSKVNPLEDEIYPQVKNHCCRRKKRSFDSLQHRQGRWRCYVAVLQNSFGADGSTSWVKDATN